MAALVPDDSLLRFAQPEIFIFLTKRAIFHPGLLLPSNALFTDDEAPLPCNIAKYFINEVHYCSAI